MKDLRVGELVIRVDRSGSACLRLDWLGRSESWRPSEAIRPFFEQALAEASAAGCSLDMHFEALEYCNSATFATLIQLMYAAGKEKVPLRMSYDPRRSWQAVSFEALERAAGSFGCGEWPKVEFSSVRP